MALKLASKDPDETLDYPIDWTPRGIEGDTITSLDIEISGDDASLIDIPERLNINTPTTTFWLEGGTNLATYELLLTATTAAGRIMQQTYEMKLKQK
jgi:hypothetical protein